MTDVYVVPPHLVGDLWPSIKEYADRAVAYHPFIDGEDVLTILWTGGARLFIATDAKGVLGFAAAEVVDYPRVRAINMLAAGGRRGFLPVLTGPVLDAIDAWGREVGAVVFTAQGRVGWIKVAGQQRGSAVGQSLIWREIEGAPHVRRRKEADHYRDPRPVGSSAPLPH